MSMIHNVDKIIIFVIIINVGKELVNLKGGGVTGALKLYLPRAKNTLDPALCVLYLKF